MNIVLRISAYIVLSCFMQDFYAADNNQQQRILMRGFGSPQLTREQQLILALQHAANRPQIGRAVVLQRLLKEERKRNQHQLG